VCQYHQIKAAAHQRTERGGKKNKGRNNDLVGEILNAKRTKRWVNSDNSEISDLRSQIVWMKWMFGKKMWQTCR